MDSALSSLFLMRGFERVVDCMLGGFALWLGWKLFAEGCVMEQQITGEGEIKGAKLKIQSMKVGPGILFALFGATIIGISQSSVLKWNDSGEAEIASGKSTKTAKETAATDAAKRAKGASFQFYSSGNRNNANKLVRAINTVNRLSKQDRSAQQQKQLESALAILEVEKIVVLNNSFEAKTLALLKAIKSNDEDNLSAEEKSNVEELREWNSQLIEAGEQP